MKKQNGNSLTIVLIFMGIFLIILILLVAVLIGNVNGIIQGVRTDLYLINKSAIVSVNKNTGSIDVFSYHEKEYLKYFKKAIEKNYHLDDHLENSNGLIQKVLIDEYKIYTKNQRDSFSKKRADGTIIHTVITVKMRPIILEKELEKYFTFKIHEDVYMEREKI